MKANNIRVTIPRDSFSDERVTIFVAMAMVSNEQLDGRTSVGLNGVDFNRFVIDGNGARLAYYGYEELVAKPTDSAEKTSLQIFDPHANDCAKPIDGGISLIEAVALKIWFDDLASGFDRDRARVLMRVKIAGRFARAWLPGENYRCLEVALQGEQARGNSPDGNSSASICGFDKHEH